VRLDRIRQHTFAADWLAPGATVLDLGGNRGDFARAMVERHRCRCVVVEASPDLCATMPLVDGMRVINCAVAERSGSVAFHLAANSEASSLAPPPGGAVAVREVPALDLPALAEREGLQRIDLLKMDIEGAELSVLRTVPEEFLARVAQLTVEFHDFAGSPLGEIRAVVARLESLGFASVRFSGRDWSDVWFANRRLRPLPAWRVAWLRAVTRNLRGLGRLAGRR
jgi:FkbM family methyltransferase